MYRLLLTASLLFLLLTLPSLSQQQAPHVVETDPLTPEKQREKFRLPAGFEIQLVAAEPQIYKPMNLAFDDQGRLWVTDTLEYPFPAEPGVKPRDTVKILSDFGPNGRARKITTFADGLNIPIGVLPLPGVAPREALVFGIPNIWRLQDRLGRGGATDRSIAYGEFGSRDTHGMTNAFLYHLDGWVYACHGFANQSTVKGSDNQAITMHSGNTYRMRPDGSHLEQFTWGQVNPFGLSIDQWGYVYTSDCHSEPIYQLMRGGYYPSFGKPHDGLGFAPTMFTGYKGSTAVAGLIHYEADAFPKSYRNSAFVGDVMTNEIVEFRIRWNGASPSATQHTFVDCTDRWFRPVDLKLGPDGALYVADFYNRIIGHYEVPLTHPGRDRERGRIWRIVYKGNDVRPTPGRSDFTKATTNDLVADLGHPNALIRRQATHELVRRGGNVVVGSVRLCDRPEALYVLERLGQLDEAKLKQTANNSSELLRVHAQRILAERKVWKSWERDLVLEGLKDVSPHVRRVSAEALGLHPHSDHVPALLDCWQSVPASDTHLTHTLRIALRHQLRDPAAWMVARKCLSSRSTDRDRLLQVSLGVPSTEAAKFLLNSLPEVGLTGKESAERLQHIARYGDERTRSELIALASQSGTPIQQAGHFRAMERGLQQAGVPIRGAMRDWGTQLTRTLLDSKQSNQVVQGIELTRILKLEESQNKIATLARQADTNHGTRVAALDALFAIDASKHAMTCGEILTDTNLPIESREHAARLLAQANQSPMRALLLAALPTATARLQNSIAVGLASSPEGAEALLQAISSGKASARLLQEQAVVSRLQAAKVTNLKERLEKLTAGLPPADAKLAQLLAARRSSFLRSKPDLQQGAAVFEKHCAICHQVAGKGAKIGPQLDGIGLRGLERLLEDTLDPGRNVDEAFRLTRLQLTSGKSVEGLFLREEGAVLVLADSQGKEVRVPKEDVEERSVSNLSPMPANLAEQLTEAEFNHLIGYLLSLKPSKP